MGKFSVFALRTHSYCLTYSCRIWPVKPIMHRRYFWGSTTAPSPIQVAGYQESLGSCCRAQAYC